YTRAHNNEPLGGVMKLHRRIEIIDGEEVEVTWEEDDEEEEAGESSATEITKPEQLPLEKMPDTWPAAFGNGTPNARSGTNVLWYCEKRGINVRFNEFDQRTYVHHNGRWMEMTDAVIRAVMVEMHDAGCLSAKNLVSEMLHHLGARNRVHPVREYVNSLTWDRKRRLPKLLPYYLRAEDNPLNRA